jgi:hypothetical protein
MSLAGLRRTTIIPVFLAMLLAVPPATFAQDGDSATGSEIAGKVELGEGGGLAGATVLAYHLSSEEVFTSTVTNTKGQYQILDLPYGYFDIAVETEEGLYLATQVVNVSPSGKTVLTLVLAKYTADDAADARTFPGSDAEPIGLASIEEKAGGAAFWKSPAGIGIIAGGGALLLLLIASGGDSDDTPPPASASAPTD